MRHELAAGVPARSANAIWLPFGDHAGLGPAAVMLAASGALVVACDPTAATRTSAVAAASNAPKRPPIAARLLREDVVRLGERLDRVLRVVERRLRNHHRQGLVLRALELRVDPRGGQDLLDLLRLGDVARDRELDHPRHYGADCTASTRGSGSKAPPFSNCGAPRSGNGISTTSKSRGTTVSANTSRASLAASGPKYRDDRCVSASIRTRA